MIRKYVLDANVFIEPAKKYYAFDLVPKYWNYLCTCVENGMMCSIDKVRDELLQDQQLINWANTKFPRWESTKNAEAVNEFRNITEFFKSNQHYTKGAKDNFANKSKADAWVISYAKINNCIVVTDERWNQERRRQIPIPNACNILGVEWIGIIEMLQSLKIVLSD